MSLEKMSPEDIKLVEKVARAMFDCGAGNEARAILYGNSYIKWHEIPSLSPT